VKRVNAKHECLREKGEPTEGIRQIAVTIRFKLCHQKLVRKGGFEPPRLSAPPPQDGVSASSTTSAVYKLRCLIAQRNIFELPRRRHAASGATLILSCTQPIWDSQTPGLRAFCGFILQACDACPARGGMKQIRIDERDS
jgi:hypothetical protein